MCSGDISGNFAKLLCIPDIKRKQINRVKKEIAQARRKIQEILEIMENSAPDGELEWLIERMVVDERGKIELPGDYCDWYWNDEFALWLKDFLEEGTMEFVNEDGGKWGYWFDGKGNVHELKYPRTSSEKQVQYSS